MEGGFLKVKRQKNVNWVWLHLSFEKREQNFGCFSLFPLSLRDEKENKTLALCFAERFLKGGFQKVCI
jgi:hypothetical protein